MKVFMSLVLVLAVLLSGVALAAGDGEAKKPAKTGEKELVQKTPRVVPFPVPEGGVIVCAMVGAQMSWVLRPFIGSPDMKFTWFRERQSNFFLDVIRSIGELFGA